MVSPLAVATFVPSGLNSMPHTQPLWFMQASSRPLAASHTRAVLSALAVAKHVPSGLNATPSTPPPWLTRPISRPVCAFHSRAD